MTLESLDSILELRSIALALPLAQIYEGEALYGSHFEYRISVAGAPSRPECGIIQIARQPA